MTGIHIENLSKSYGNKSVLDSLTLDLQPGRIIGLLGANGQGKSTLMKLIAGLAIADNGSILLDGVPMDADDKNRIAFLPEMPSLDPSRTPRQIMAYLQDFYEGFDSDKALDLLAQMEIQPDQRLSSMSKGMQEKAALAMVLAREADFYLLDEPLGGVDPVSRDRILQTILKNYNTSGTVLISTHLISDVEPILDEVIFLKDGKILRQSQADALRMETGTSIDQTFRKEFSKC